MSMRDLALGRYLHNDSPVHRLDPRTKLGALFLMMTTLFGGGDWAAVGATFALAVAAALFSGLGASVLMRSVLPFKWLILLTAGLNILFTGGHILVELPLPYGGVTVEGLNDGLLYGSRIGVMVFAASLLTLTTEPIVLVYGIERLLSPLRRLGVSTADLAVAMVVTIRFIPLFVDEAAVIRKSLAARGYRPKKSIAGGIRTANLVMFPLFVTAVRKAEMLAVAMESRLYRVGADRSRYGERSMGFADWCVLAAVAVVCICTTRW